MRLETERLILRDYEPRDLAAYYQLKSCRETMYYLQDIRLFSPEAAAAELAAVLRDQKRADRTFYFLHMEEKRTGRPVGSTGYTVTGRTPAGRLVHAGYFLFPAFWGRGCAAEALRRVLEFAFTEDNAARVSTGCLCENVRSERVMRKCGLIREAVRPRWEWHDGRWKDRVEYRILRSEWEQTLPETARGGPQFDI